MPHESVRPSFEDDIVIPVRVRPSSLELLQEGMECRHVRLDIVPGDRYVFDIYTETRQDIDAVPAWDAPHSPRFNAAREADR